MERLNFLIPEHRLTILQENALYYMAGYIARSLIGPISCPECTMLLLANTKITHEQHDHTNITASCKYEALLLPHKGLRRFDKTKCSSV